MEMYWNLISHITSIVFIGVKSYLFYRFVKPFLLKTQHAWTIGISYCVSMLVMYTIPLEMEFMVAEAVSVLIAFIMMYRIDYRNREQKIFLAITMYLLGWLSHGIISVPRSILMEYFLNTTFMAARPIRQVVGFAFIQIVYISFRALVMVFFIHTIHKKYIYKNENMSRKEFLLMLLPLLLILSGYGAFTYFATIYLVDTEQYVFRIHPEYSWIEALYQVISYLVMMTTIVIYQSIKESHQKETEGAVLEGQIENMKQHIHEVEVLYNDIRGIKHDMGNHIIILENLFQSSEKEAMEYLTNWKEQLGDVTTDIKTGNPVTDVIINEKWKAAEEYGVKFHCEFFYPKETAINAFDVSVILNNALDNAITGCKSCKNAYIRIFSYRKKNAYMIEIINNYREPLILDEGSGLPISSKTEREEHGFGLNNIRKVAQKYMGDVDIEQDGEEFRLSIMLMLK